MSRHARLPSNAATTGAARVAGKDALASKGPLRQALGEVTIAAVNVAIYLTTLFFYLRGRSVRLWLYQTDMFAKLNL